MIIKKNVFNKNLEYLKDFLESDKTQDKLKMPLKHSFDNKVIFNILNFSNIDSAKLDIILDIRGANLTSFMNKFIVILEEKPQEDLNKILLPSNINDNNKIDKFFKYIENLTIKDIFDINDKNIDEFKKEFNNLMEESKINENIFHSNAEDIFESTIHDKNVYLMCTVTKNKLLNQKNSPNNDLNETNVTSSQKQIT